MRSVTLVYGPPCAGKTTWVRQHSTPGDLIIDWDTLAIQAGSPVEHDHHPTHAAAATRRRKQLEHQVMLMRTGTAFIIRTLPDRRDLTDVIERLRVTTVKRVDPGMDVCLMRAREAGRTPEVINAIHNWYRNGNRNG